MTYEELVNQIEERFAKKIPLGSYKMLFNACKQEAGEEPGRFAERLEDLYELAFPPDPKEKMTAAKAQMMNEQRDKRLNESFLTGSENHLKKHLLSREPKTFHEAVKQATKKRMIERETEFNIEEVRPQTNWGPKKSSCDFCGINGHKMADCQSVERAKNGTGCAYCGRSNHKADTCTDRKNPNRPARTGPDDRACYKCGGQGHLRRNCSTKGVGIPGGPEPTPGAA